MRDGIPLEMTNTAPFARILVRVLSSDREGDKQAATRVFGPSRGCRFLKIAQLEHLAGALHNFIIIVIRRVAGSHLPE